MLVLVGVFATVGAQSFGAFSQPVSWFVVESGMYIGTQFILGRR